MKYCSATNLIHQFVSTRSPTKILLYGLIVRLVALLYCVIHDNYVSLIKYTDIDYHVYSNASEAIWKGHSPYQDHQFKYTPLTALIYLPNILINYHAAKGILIFADIICGAIIYNINILKGANRVNSKIFLLVWLLNPVTIAISTRGSFEPIVTLFVLIFINLLFTEHYILAGIAYGAAIHLKLYPIIYLPTIYVFIMQRKPQLRNQTYIYYWTKTLSPTKAHFKFFVTTGLLIASLSYGYYIKHGDDYIENSLLYHLRRRDTNHNFSPYFYLFRLFPTLHTELNFGASIVQYLAIAILTKLHLSLYTNRRAKMRKFCFSLFTSTYMFVSLNKVCTSQYFNWYLIYLPLIMDSIELRGWKAYVTAAIWFVPQGIWLMFAYLYEFRHMEVLHLVGQSSILFLICNLTILVILSRSFIDLKRQTWDDKDSD